MSSYDQTENTSEGWIMFCGKDYKPFNYSKNEFFFM
jgi:hypothetical protein